MKALEYAEQIYENSKFLPPRARRELFDFSEFLKNRYVKRVSESEPVPPDDPDYALAKSLDDGDYGSIDEHPELVQMLKKVKGGMRILQGLRSEG